MKFSTAIVCLTAAPAVTSFMTPSIIKGQMNTASTIKVSSQDFDLEKEMSKRTLYDPLGLYSSNSNEYKEGRIFVDSTMAYEMVEINSEMTKRSIYDPLRLYPTSSQERQFGLIQSLENEDDIIMNNTNKPITDPLNLYKNGNKKQVDQTADMSKSLPFLVRPTVLDGSLVGDVGFDPLGLAASKEQLLNLREAELKHSRLAMLVSSCFALVHKMEVLT